jgi:membrane protease subunit (stomatin/prohibitin family)
VYEGELANVFTPGLYLVEIKNMPIMKSLWHWDHGFKRSFRSEVCFVK